MKKSVHIYLLFFLSGISAKLLYANGGGQPYTTTICEGRSVEIQATPNQLSYLWSPNQDISDITISNPVFSPTQTTTYYLEITPPSDINFVVNGDFEQGNTGFQSDYNFTASPTTNQGFYGIFNDPQQFNGGFGACQDHGTTGSGLMMVVDGATVLNENVWCQTIDVDFYTTYDFSAWIANIHPTAPSILQFSINGELLDAPLQIQNSVCAWTEFTSEWFSDCESTATICITNQSTIAFGNDFAIDDISFSYSETPYIDTFHIIVLESSLTSIDTIACENGSVFFEGESIPAGTKKDFTYTAFNGCDSTISIDVALIDTFYFETRTDTLCPGESIFYRGFEIFKDTAICDIYTNALGCDSTYCFVVYFLSEATIAITEQKPACIGDANGSLFAVPFAGVPPYQYLWNTGATSPLVDQLSAGTYFLTVTDSKNCVAEKTIVLDDPPRLALDFIFQSPSCFEDQDGNIEIFPSGGVPDYILQWEGNIIENTFLDSLSGGTYSLVLQDSEGCLLDTQVVLLKPNPISISTIQDTSVALGQSLELSTGIFSGLPYIFDWTPVLDMTCPECESPEILPLESRLYQIVVEDTLGCTSTASINVGVLKNYEIFVPNAFSPNDDGLNDLLEIYTGKDVALIENFSVYDRWGGTLFEQKDCLPGTGNCSWDGKFNSVNLETGVYVYLLKVQFIDHSVKVFAGDVLLLR